MNKLVLDLDDIVFEPCCGDNNCPIAYDVFLNHILETAEPDNVFF